MKYQSASTYRNKLLSEIVVDRALLNGPGSCPYVYEKIPAKHHAALVNT